MRHLKQENVVDCGVFTLQICKAICFGEEPVITQDNINKYNYRFQIFQEFINHSLFSPSEMNQSTRLPNICDEELLIPIFSKTNW